MSEKVNCPFCGEIIESDVDKCPFCGSLFAEPELSGIKFQEFRIFFALMFLTGGFFSILWFFINAKAINNLTIKAKDAYKLNWWLLVLSMSFIACFLGRYWSALTIFTLIMLTYRTLRIIQKYTYEKYNVVPEINPYYIGIFNIFYLIHFIDTYRDRVLEVHEHFNWQMYKPLMFALILAFISLQIACVISPAAHNFYQWLFGTVGIK